MNVSPNSSPSPAPGLLPMRTAQEQFQLASYHSQPVATDQVQGLVYVGSGRDACLMRMEEWVKYLELCQMWLSSARDLEGVPPVPQAEDPFAILDSGMLNPDSGIQPEDLLRVLGSLRQALAQARGHVESAQVSLCVDDYGEALAAAVERLSLSIGCVDRLKKRLAVSGGPLTVIGSKAEAERVSERLRPNSCQECHGSGAVQGMVPHQNGGTVVVRRWCTCTKGREMREYYDSRLGESTPVADVVLPEPLLPRWPLGINPAMDEHAAALGLVHWSCYSKDSNESWVRIDGARCSPFLSGEINAGYVGALHAFDVTNPMRPSTRQVTNLSHISKGGVA